MEKRLKWNAIGLYKKTETLKDALVNEKDLIPETHSKQLKKLNGFINELTQIIEKMDQITLELIPDLEERFRVTFPVPEMIMIALSRPSIRTIFDNIRTYYQSKGTYPIKYEEFSELASSGDAGNVLALIGDAVIDLAVVQTFWDSSIATAGDLTKKRVTIVSNENLAKVCDEWKLYEYRLDRVQDPSKKLSKEDRIDHEKGTLVEAIFGVIYLEFDYDELIRILPLIQ